MTEPVNLTQRLEVLRDHLLGAPSPNSLSDVHAAVEAILGPLESQVTLYHLLAGLRGPTATNLGDVLEGLAALKGSGADNLTTMGAKLDEVVSQLDNVRQAIVAQEGRLDSIQAALGGEPYNDLELATTRGLLQALLNCCRAARLGEFPATQPTDGRSVGAVISGGRKYALWPNPPEGVTVAANGFDITANWSGWQAYIQTTDPAPQIGGVADAPNMWLELVGTGTINFSVELNYPITVHLRPPTIGVPYTIWEGPTVLTKTANDGSEERILITVTPPPGAELVEFDVVATPNELNLLIEQNGYALASGGLNYPGQGQVALISTTAPVTLSIGGFWSGHANGHTVTVTGFVKLIADEPG